MQLFKHISKDSLLTFGVIMLAAVALAIFPDMALADGSDPIGDKICVVVKWFSGTTGKAIATIAIIVLGISAFFGKVTWGMALMFAIGIGAIFGASTIIQQLGANGAAC